MLPLKEYYYQIFTNPGNTRMQVGIIYTFLLFVARTFAVEPKVECQACRDFVESFWKGHETTANSNFGGGNTDWEETRLGSYATSETRLVEILEHACTSGKDKDQCHQFAERNEEQIEKWYFHLQKNEPDFMTWLCIKTAKVCCPQYTFGKNCDKCPGEDGFEPCFGRGECDGSGTKGGTGKCRCQKGYTGALCDTCNSGFDEMEKNATFVLCEDINECELDPLTCPDREYCFNTEGSYKCTKCHSACKGCTGAGAARCKMCADGFVLSNQTCIVPRQKPEDTSESSGNFESRPQIIQPNSENKISNIHSEGEL